MEFINKFYVKVDKKDLSDCINNEFCDTSLIFEMFNCINEYENMNGVSVDSFYLSVLSKHYRCLSNIFSIPIKRSTLINAYIQSLILQDQKKLILLSDYIMHKELSFKENICLFNYVLNHSMDIDEFLNGQDLKLVFNDETCELEKNYIYNNSKQKKIS